jgi:hypothetical protein
LQTDIEETIWQNFKQECKEKNIKPNKQVDPLKPSEGNKKSLERFVWDLKRYQNKTIADWAFELIVQNKMREVHQDLKTVWGVGDKIASFYLRDIFWLGHSLKPDPTQASSDVYCLQPIDIWVKRAAEALGCNQPNNPRYIARFVFNFEKTIGIPPGGGNIAFWMLGSHYVDSDDEFFHVLKAICGAPGKDEKDCNAALSVAHRFISSYGKFGQILRSILT